MSTCGDMNHCRGNCHCAGSTAFWGMCVYVCVCVFAWVCVYECVCVCVCVCMCVCYDSRLGGILLPQTHMRSHAVKCHLLIDPDEIIDPNNRFINQFINTVR